MTNHRDPWNHTTTSWAAIEVRARKCQKSNDDSWARIFIPTFCSHRNHCSCCCFSQ